MSEIAIGLLVRVPSLLVVVVLAPAHRLEASVIMRCVECVGALALIGIAATIRH